MSTASIPFPDLVARVNQVKPVSKRQVYRYLDRLRIQPLGHVITKPRLYPGDAADRVIEMLGLAPLADLRRHHHGARPRRTS